MKKTKNMYMIGNAHLDPVWLWQWQEGFQEVKATFRSALDRMNEYEEFVFTSSSAAFYEWVELNDKPMFDEIQARIAEGRWFLAGGWWVQSDCNIPSGEGFVRQALVGQRYFLEKFGKIATYGYNVDSFGHHGMMPQILAKSGCTSYVFMRPMPLEKGLPGRTFTWESSDGSRVTAYRLPYEYLSWKDELSEHVLRCADEIKAPLNLGMCFYGVGNHGGGPTKANIESIRELQKSEDLPELLFSTPEEFFAAVEASSVRLPVYHGDLQHHASGCYAAHSEVKRLNRLSENRLLAAEKYSSIAAILGKQPYPKDFTHAWKQVLFNQFHDILAGTSLREAYDDAAYLYGEAISIADRNMNYALQSLSWAIDIKAEEASHPLVVFNPHSWDVTTAVSLEFGKVDASYKLIDDEGAEIPFQIIQSSAAARGRNKIVFVPTVPSLGYRVYRLQEGKQALQENKQEKQELPSSHTLENAYLKVTFDQETGCIESLYDKEAKFSVLKGQGAQPVIIEDASDTWSHGIYNFWAHGKKTLMQLSSIRCKECGPVQSTIEVVHTYNNSSIVQLFTLGRESRQLAVHVVLDWHEKLTMVKLRFPLNLNFRKAVSEIPYGTIERAANGDEQPGQAWVDVSGQGKGFDGIYGLALANDAKYSYDFDLDTMDMTVLRSAAYAHHEPMVLDDTNRYFYLDQGIQEFDYLLLPHKGNWQSSAIWQKSAELNQRLTVIKESGHSGPLAQKASFLTISNPSVMMSTLKRSESDDAWILRLCEVVGEEVEVDIEIGTFNCRFASLFGPYEIQTFKITFDEKSGTSGVTATNLLELTEDEMPKRQ